MDLKLTDGEERVLDNVHTQLKTYISGQYDKVYQQLQNKIDADDQDKLQVLIDKLVKKRDRDIDVHWAMADKVAMLLHDYRLNGIKQTTLLEFMQYVFLYQGDDYNNIKQRRELNLVLQYFAADGGIKLLYVITDAQGRIMSVQNPSVDISAEGRASIINVDLLGNGNYQYEKLASDQYKCFLPDHPSDAVIITPDNFREHLEVFYSINSDPDIRFSMNEDADKINKNVFTVNQISHKTEFNDSNNNSNNSKGDN